MQAGLFPNWLLWSFQLVLLSFFFFMALFQAPPAPFLAFFQASHVEAPPPIQASHGPWDPVAVLQANFCSSLSNSFLCSFFSSVAAAHFSFCWQGFFSSSLTSSASSSQALCLWLPSCGCCTGCFSSLGPAVSN